MPTMDESYTYPGQELDLFEYALKWKKYFSDFIQQHIGGHVLECGAGIGATSKILNNSLVKEWTLLEPDKKMVALLKNKINNQELPVFCKVEEGDISVFENKPQFDTILYIDVLEHLKNDREELVKAAALLNQKGKLIILSPAFPALYSNFDKAIGHYKRYTKKELLSIMPESMNKISLRYLDSSGFFLSFANKTLLKQKYPTRNQINFWDSYIVPISKISDRIVNYSFGKSILGIWEKK